MVFFIEKRVFTSSLYHRRLQCNSVVITFVSFLVVFLGFYALGSDGSFAERLNSMGMPLDTAALVDACDPSSDPGTPKNESRLARMHSDTTIVVRKSPTSSDADHSGITHRPMSLMPAVSFALLLFRIFSLSLGLVFLRLPFIFLLYRVN